MTRSKLALAGLAAFAAAAAIPASARADTRILATQGLWSAYSGIGHQDRALCGIATTGADGRRILIQQYSGENGVLFSLQKDSWTVPEGTQMELRVQFDTAEATLARASGAGHLVEVEMTFEQSVPFMRDLRYGRQIQISFPNGNEAGWTGGLLGSGRAIDVFNECRMNFPPPGGPTQPFVRAAAPPAVQAPPGAPTQPFSGATQAAPASGGPSNLTPPPSDLPPLLPPSKP
jgi:hypothetical protein